MGLLTFNKKDKERMAVCVLGYVCAHKGIKICLMGRSWG